MLTEPEDLPAELVLRLVREHWDPRVRSAGFMPRLAGAPRWVCGGRRTPRWVARADDVTSPGRLEELEAAYAVARELLSRGGHFVVPTRPPATGGIGVPHGRHLLTLTAYLEGETGPGAYADDGQRALLARHLGQLHAMGPPWGCQPWRPATRSGGVLDHALSEVLRGQWSGGPYGEAARIVVGDNRRRLEALMRRDDALAAEASRRRASWVLTHGEPHSGNVLWSLGGPLLLDWGSVRIAPRERDLRQVLRGAEGPEPLSAYVAAGGTAELDADMVELFDLEERLGRIGECAARLARPHGGGADDARCFESLRAELAPAVVRPEDT